MCHDMHDACGNYTDPVRAGDDWLAGQMPGILNSDVYREGGAVFLCWDEGDHNLSDGPIGMLVLSPLAKGNGYASTNYYTHSSLLRTMQEIFGVTPLLGDAANAADLSDLFRGTPVITEAHWAYGQFQFRLMGVPAPPTAEIQTSTDLLNWTTLTITRSTGSVMQVTLPATNQPRGFYRSMTR
jgi:hypothetical protein